MTQMTERGPSLSPERHRLVVPALGLLRGVLAAGLGLGSLTVLVTVLWISSPEPGSGPGEALHVAAALWLLGHGAEVIRTDTLTGTPAPVGLVPLLLTTAPFWLVHRTARDVMEPDDDGPVPSSGRAFTLVTGGYLMVGAAVALYARSGSMAPAPLSLLIPCAVVAAAAGTGVWSAAGRPIGPPPSWAPVRMHEALARTRFRARLDTALRSAGAGVAVLLGGGALLVAVSLVVHADAAQTSFRHLSGDWAGRISVLLLALVLVPNAAVWAASYGLGPGFALGTGATVTPLAFTGRPALPDFPLLAAVPAEGPGTALHWAAVAVPVAAGATVGWFTVRRAAPVFGERDDAWSAGETALTVALGALGCGAGAAVLATAAGGPLGTHALAEFGPRGWLTGAAAVAWTLLIGVPCALSLRAWRLRQRGGDEEGQDGTETPALFDASQMVEPADAPSPAAADGGEPPEARGRRRRWWPWGGNRGNASTPQTATEETPAPDTTAPVPGKGEADADLTSYDFLPTGPWQERTARPEEAGPSHPDDAGS